MKPRPPVWRLLIVAPVTWSAGKNTHPNWMFRFCSSFFSSAFPSFIPLLIVHFYVIREQNAAVFNPDVETLLRLWRLLISLVLGGFGAPCLWLQHSS